MKGILHTFFVVATQADYFFGQTHNMFSRAFTMLEKFGSLSRERNMKASFVSPNFERQNEIHLSSQLFSQVTRQIAVVIILKRLEDLEYLARTNGGIKASPQIRGGVCSSFLLRARL
jgi:hypothetical protein